MLHVHMHMYSMHTHQPTASLTAHTVYRDVIEDVMSCIPMLKCNPAPRETRRATQLAAVSWPSVF